MSEDQKCHHEWTDADRDFQCTACGATCATCNVCLGPSNSALLVCQRCLDREAQVLTHVREALSHWQPQPRSLVPAVRYDKDRLHRSSAGETTTATDETPADIEGVLWDWCAMWADLSKKPRNDEPTSYLRGMLIWAAHNADAAGWDDYRREMRQLRHRARRLAGLTPQRQAGPCVYCGGDVVRDWADENWRPRADGLSDELRCARCHTEWESRQHWQFANRHTILTLPLTHPDRLVTRDDARMIFPAVPAPTWRSWVHRDARRAEALLRYREMLDSGRIGPPPEPQKMPGQGFDHRGRELYRLADLTALVEARIRDARPGRKAG